MNDTATVIKWMFVVCGITYLCLIAAKYLL